MVRHTGLQLKFISLLIVTSANIKVRTAQTVKLHTDSRNTLSRGRFPLTDRPRPLNVVEHSQHEESNGAL